MDDEAVAFHEKVRAGYLEMAASEPERFLLLNGLDRAEDLVQAVMDEMKGRFPDAL